jgi:sugar phosphate isomerase/epimerase
MKMSNIPVALQLYTVRERLAKDYPGTLAQVKKIGYNAVQLTGNIPYDGPRMKQLLGDLGLAPAGVHIAPDSLEHELNKWIEFCSVIGTKDLICPYLPEEWRIGESGWLDTAERLNKIGQKCSEAGKRLSYHNHSFEFEKFSGKYALDLLFEQTSEKYLMAELDTYWIKHGGEDPVEYIRKYAGRIPILHLKDMADDKERSFAEIGQGLLNWDEIFKAGAEAGVEWFCVEQDVCRQDPLESARISLEFIRAKTDKL